MLDKFHLTYFLIIFIAFIESVVQVPSNNNQEASPMSLLIRTPKRDLKLTAPTLERHEIWFKVKRVYIVVNNRS